MKRLATILVMMSLVCAGDIFACTTVIISAKASASGRPIIWKQRDTSGQFNYLDHFAGGSFPFTGIVASDDADRESVWCGVNKAGFAIMNSQSYGLSPLKGVDRPYEGMVMKRALETCSTVHDFEMYIASLPQPNGLEANFGVIDAFGGAAFFEVHDYGYQRFDASDTREGYLIRTNYSFTGREREGHGYDRYERAAAKMAAHSGGFTPAWLIDELGRDDLIARGTTTCSVAVEGVAFRERPDASCIWCCPGHPLGSYTVCAWMAAGDRIPRVLRSSRGRGDHTSMYSPLNEIADALKGKDVLAAVMEAEREELSDAETLDHSFRQNGFDPVLLASYNDAADARFELFRKSVGF